jgi:hypothetical protein
MLLNLLSVTLNIGYVVGNLSIDLGSMDGEPFKQKTDDFVQVNLLGSLLVNLVG